MVVLGFDTNSLKYLAASFVATYCSGLTHPLDVIKTRLQSMVQIIKVTMEEQKETLFQNTDQ